MEFIRIPFQWKIILFISRSYCYVYIVDVIASTFLCAWNSFSENHGSTADNKLSVLLYNNWSIQFLFGKRVEPKIQDGIYVCWWKITSIRWDIWNICIFVQTPLFDKRFILILKKKDNIHWYNSNIYYIIHTIWVYMYETLALLAHQFFGWVERFLQMARTQALKSKPKQGAIGSLG